jgi:type IV pilus assembly protein PilC
MPVFEYEIADGKGVLSRGRAEAESQGALVSRFREQGRLVVGIRLAGRPVLGGGLAVAPLAHGVRRGVQRLTRGVSVTTLLMFTSQLAAMLGGGLHLARILGSLAAETSSRPFRAVLESVRDTLSAGATFADALARHPHVFDGLYVSVIRAGEVSGSLPIVLDALTVYLEKTAQLRRKVLGAVAYPAVILGVSTAIVFFMIVKLVPVFEGVYARANAALPAPTRMLVAVSAAIRDSTLSVLLGAALVVGLLALAVNTDGGRRLLDRVKLRMPVFGPLIRRAVMARTCRMLSVLLSSGIPLIEAMETVARASGNKVVEEALASATAGIQDGGTVADALKRTGEFPSMVIQFVATGEESGTLASMLARAAGYYEQQVDASVATLSTLIEPVMIVVMGALAGAVIFALYLPIFSLGQAIKGGVR